MYLGDLCFQGQIDCDIKLQIYNCKFSFRGPINDKSGSMDRIKYILLKISKIKGSYTVYVYIHVFRTIDGIVYLKTTTTTTKVAHISAFLLNN